MQRWRERSRPNSRANWPMDRQGYQLIEDVTYLGRNA
jgi:hypothetical protein